MWHQTRLHSQSLPRCMMSGIYSALPSVLLVNVSVASSFDSSPHFKTDNTTTTPAPGICPEGWIEAIEGCFMFHHTGEMDISRYWHFNSIKWSHQFHLLQILNFDSKAIQQNVAIAKKIHFLYANSENYTIVVILEECISTHTGGESDFKSHLFFVTGCIIDCFSIRHPLRNDGCGK